MHPMDKLNQLVSDIRYQCMHGVHTYSKCAKSGCNQSSRSGGVCRHCLADELGELCGEEGIASSFMVNTASASKCLGKIEELVEAKHADKG
jgi:hypothetical protein